MIRKQCLFILVIFGWILFDSAIIQAEDEIKWYSHAQGVALAKQKQKKIFVHFYADWCPYCKKMEKGTLKNPAIVDYLNRNFVSVRVNSDKEAALARDYSVRGLPSTWFVSETGEKISNLPGYISAKVLLRVLEYIHTNSYKKMDFQDFVPSDE